MRDLVVELALGLRRHVLPFLGSHAARAHVHAGAGGDVTFEVDREAEDYLEQFHSTSSLARELMPPAEAARFGAAVLAAVRDHERDGLLDLPVTTDLTWGRPSA